ncbi:hypothetical protein AVEN_111876-1 [Araneus ventricosus]|uniref:Uncharacterized protein n=1 Tax=Araneus ventricosus TaxID=182803 RepID=A0A4Y2BYZ6_ARAVE|nr:hypothetical protein AVEN_111876-1 [Araneus ventricosus]
MHTLSLYVSMLYMPSRVANGLDSDVFEDDTGSKTRKTRLTCQCGQMREISEGHRKLKVVDGEFGLVKVTTCFEKKLREQNEKTEDNFETSLLRTEL